jgi:hypothetical protein
VRRGARQPRERQPGHEEQDGRAQEGGGRPGQDDAGAGGKGSDHVQADLRRRLERVRLLEPPRLAGEHALPLEPHRSR